MAAKVNYPCIGRAKIMSVFGIRLCWFPAVLRSGRLSDISAFAIVRRESGVCLWPRVESKSRKVLCNGMGAVGCKEWLAKSLALCFPPVRFSAFPSLFWVTFGLSFFAPTQRARNHCKGNSNGTLENPPSRFQMQGPAFAPLCSRYWKWAVSSMQRRHFFLPISPR